MRCEISKCPIKYKEKCKYRLGFIWGNLSWYRCIYTNSDDITTTMRNKTMTREEAIKVLKQMKEGYIAVHNGNTVMWEFSDYGVQAFDMAIMALDREQRKYGAICDELLSLASNLNEPLEVAVAYEKSVNIVKKYARMGETE